MRRNAFQIIADQTGRDMISRSAIQSLLLNTAVENFDLNRTAISKHLKIVLE